jgi:hypothetical protein
MRSDAVPCPSRKIEKLLRRLLQQAKLVSFSKYPYSKFLN